MSTDPWNHEYLMGSMARKLTDGKVGKEVRVVRFFQKPIVGELMRVTPEHRLVIAGYGSVSVAEVEAVEVLP